jgi:hypothetical protein
VRWALVHADINLETGRASFKGGSGSIAEMGSLSLEFKSLA